MKCQIQHSVSHEDARWIHDNLYAYNLEKTGEERQEILLEQDPERQTFLALNAEGKRLGGCCWRMRKDEPVLFIDFLWMSDEARGTGCGAALIQAVEAKALEQKYRGVQLGTNTFQAPGFYLKMGYKIISEESSPKKNCPENKHYVFRKIF